MFLYDVSETHDFRRLLADRNQLQDMVGRSKPMQILFRLIRDLARVDTTVLIEGETGTGKEPRGTGAAFVEPPPLGPVHCPELRWPA